MTDMFTANMSLVLSEGFSGLLSGALEGEACSEADLLANHLFPPSAASPGDGLSLTLKPRPKDLQGKKFHQLPKSRSGDSCRVFFYLT